MEVTVGLSEDGAVIRLFGRFDVNAQTEFRAAVDRVLADPEAGQIKVDLAEVGYLDSSALGMLLMLHSKAKIAGHRVCIAGAQGSVRQVLDIANFGKLFSIV